jgi:Family of unknown function (DUF5808)
MDKHGDFLGFIPYDFRKPTFSRLKERMWNPGDERIITPRDFGIGWSLNLYQLRERYPWLFHLLVAAVAIRLVLKVRRFFRGEPEQE